MDHRGIRALALARAQGYFIAFTTRLGAVSVRGSWIEVGPMASADLIATMACRAELFALGKGDEAALAELVASYGFLYEPEPWVAGEA